MMRAQKAGEPKKKKNKDQDQNRHTPHDVNPGAGEGLKIEYRTVLLASASVMGIGDPHKFISLGYLSPDWVSPCDAERERES